MKRFIFILVCIISFGAYAQDEVIKTRGGFYNVEAENVSAAYNYTFLIKDLASPYLYTYSVSLEDSTSGNSATVTLSGSLDGVNFKILSSIDYTGSGSDTTIISGITTGPVGYGLLRLTVTPTDTIWIKSAFLNALPTK